MIIIHYWQYASKHYLLSHLLLGVFAAGLTLSSLSGMVTGAHAYPNRFGLTLSVTECPNPDVFGQPLLQHQAALCLMSLPSSAKRVDRLVRVPTAVRPFSASSDPSFIEAHTIRAGPMFMA